MLLTIHVTSFNNPIKVSADLPDDEAKAIAANIENGEWVELNWPAGSPDRVKVNPAFVTHIQLVS
jgi:hypothetical protein